MSKIAVQLFFASSILLSFLVYLKEGDYNMQYVMWIWLLSLACSLVSSWFYLSKARKLEDAAFVKVLAIISLILPVIVFVGLVVIFLFFNIS